MVKCTNEEVAEAIEWATEELNDSIRYQHNYKAGCLDTIITALQEYQPWTPVSERLPECKCLGMLRDGEIVLILETTVYDDLFGLIDRTAQYRLADGRIVGYVTHWKPLPEPPKGE